jgi:hypothetical protein
VTVRLTRHCAGSYETEDGRFTIVKNPSVAANMWGDFSEPWELADRGKDIGSYATLAEAKKTIVRLLAKEKLFPSIRVVLKEAT